MDLYSNEIEQVYKILRKEFKKHRMPVVDLIEAQTSDPFKILISTILSARTRDETTAAASTRLFEHVNTPSDLETLSVPEIERLYILLGFTEKKRDI
ncbi:hypothetical protein QA601_16550 [Chitinispirillales bacterium ANBcel5]|nr:hypothetical protein [Chitinispirillales bacterium ANBcel5]